MSADRETWAVVSRHFDRICDLPPGERARYLDRLELPRDQIAWLKRLLDAHDTPGGPVDELTMSNLVNLPFLPDHPEQWADRQLGPWRTGPRIARGGMSAVHIGYRADGQFDMKVAVKVLDANILTGSRQNLLFDEVRILARLEHPGIARLIDSGTTPEGNPYLVMEYVDGLTLDRYCAAHGLGVRERIALIQQAIEALEYAHQRRVIHCDIKPGNVLVNDSGRVRVVDFGIAHLLDSRLDGTEDRHLHCSPTYAAPERLRGAAPTSAQDVFSLGALLYRVLTGHNIRRAENTSADWVGMGHTGETTIIRPSSLLATEPPDDTGVPQRHIRSLRGDLDAICERALAEDPERRYQSISEFGSDLRAWTTGHPVKARDGSALYHFTCWVRRHVVATGLAFLLIMALISGTGISLWQAEQARLEAERATAVKDFVIGIFEGSNPIMTRGEDPPASELLRRGAQRIRDELADQPRLLAELLHVIGRIQLERGLIEDARESLDESLALLDGGDDYSAHALMLSDRGMVAYERGDIDAALDWSSRAHAAGRTDAIPASSRDLIAVRLADLLVVNHQPEPALELTAPVLERLETSQDPLSAPYVYALRVHGAALQLRGDLGRAETYLLKALEAQERLDPEDVFLAKIHNELGIIYWDMDRLADAANMLNLSLERKLAVYGPRHPQTLATQGNLASIHLARGNPGQAIEQMQASLEALNTLHDHSAHVDTAFTHGLLAWAHYSTQAFVPAREHARSGYDMAIELGAEDSEMLNWIGPLLGLIHLELGFDGAAVLLSELRQSCDDLETTTPLTRQLCLARMLLATDRKSGCEELSLPTLSRNKINRLPARWQRAYQLINRRCEWSSERASAIDPEAEHQWPQWLRSRIG